MSGHTEYTRSRYNRANTTQRAALETVRDAATGDVTKIRSTTLDGLVNRGWLAVDPATASGYLVTEAGHAVLARDPR